MPGYHGAEDRLSAALFCARKGWRCAAGYSVTMPNTYVSLPGFDVDDEDVETRKVHNAVARVRFINEEIASRVSNETL